MSAERKMISVFYHLPCLIFYHLDCVVCVWIGRSPTSKNLRFRDGSWCCHGVGVGTKDRGAVKCKATAPNE